MIASFAAFVMMRRVSPMQQSAARSAGVEFAARLRLSERDGPGG
jgi:hypothetical protein